MIYELTYIAYLMQAEIYPDLSGRGEINQRRGSPLRKRGTHTMPAPKGRNKTSIGARPYENAAHTPCKPCKGDINQRRVKPYVKQHPLKSKPQRGDITQHRNTENNK